MGVDAGESQFISVLGDAGGALCDDCLYGPAGYSARQGARGASRRLAGKGVIARGMGKCSACGHAKTVSRLSSPPAVVVPSPSRLEPSRVWYWEGNVQARIATHLVANGCELHQMVDTASKAPGVDVIAKRDGREIWVTVKGYPEGKGRTSPSTQCRHWFSHAMFDVVRYRTSRPDIAIGVGLPDGFATYLNLAPTVGWLRSVAPFVFYWVNEDGVVREE